jgi:hypothetical protein
MALSLAQHRGGHAPIIVLVDEVQVSCHIRLIEHKICETPASVCHWILKFSHALGISFVEMLIRGGSSLLCIIRAIAG